MSELSWLKEYLLDQWDYRIMKLILDTNEIYNSLSLMLNVEEKDNPELLEVVNSFIYLYFIKYTKDNEHLISKHITIVDYYLQENCPDHDEYGKICVDVDSLIISCIRQHIPNFNILNDKYSNSIMNVEFNEKHKVTIHLEAKLLKQLI